MLLNFYVNFWLLNFSLLTDGKFCFDSDVSNTFVCQSYCMLPEAFTKIESRLTSNMAAVTSRANKQ